MSAASDALPFFRCYCTGVTGERVAAAFAAGATSIEDQQRATGACTGCRTCRIELDDLLTALARRSASDQASAPS